ncbi:hypothetical protein Gasu2_51290 [Galdieria sulphuraria]|uniref:Magnesium transporter n=1 Tax=Galdieria sulphuraria TaxID=130081 RepID=M2Y531_GALSU|nr:hypothetical protein Gasu_17260 isoform 1 [Galdieria sulphuraria]XP_005707480.1 hypothetical protein Gasu_17260 isoform 2 [Galdieria sulphuraria]EME30959.1 hypothetical protein Gasu_17260 isoform 1 [Galdieria sulphuraria]EME30960.1 hypothetical protein Gasu_17260 isoform 2 [Galdieria sulphuraria]GJD10969.1 hypothetical protein Gasu2_51290 [Galdieria sulphuraria]|eukprot:XP_005707479.1 hypothetical protein isoform 1 [Galdieria sulphuraria]
MDAENRVEVSVLDVSHNCNKTKVSVFSIFGLDNSHDDCNFKRNDLLEGLSLENLRFVSGFPTPNLVLKITNQAILFNLEDTRGTILRDRIYILQDSDEVFGSLLEYLKEKLSRCCDPDWLKLYFPLMAMYYITEHYCDYTSLTLKQQRNIFEDSKRVLEDSFSGKSLLYLREARQGVERITKKLDHIANNFASCFASETCGFLLGANPAWSIVTEVYVEEILKLLRKTQLEGHVLLENCRSLELGYTSMLEADFVRLLSSFLFSRFLVCLFAFYTMLIEFFHSNFFKPSPSSALTAGFVVLVCGIYISAFLAIYIFQRWLTRKKFSVLFL